MSRSQPVARSLAEPSMMEAMAARGLSNAVDPNAVDPNAIDAIAIDATQLPAFERWRRALGALAQVMVDPEKTDQVLVFSIYANAGSMPKRIDRFFESDVGRRLYAEHRTIDSRTIDLDALAALPEGTLGHAYAMFLRSRGLTPAVFDAPPTEVNDPRMQYVVQRLRQTHDLWHVVTGHDTDPASEVALQAFTFAQVRAPSSGILAALGTIRAMVQLPRGEKSRVPKSVLASLLLGLRANPLPVFAWEEHWSTPLAKVRELLGIPVEGVRKPSA